MTPATSASWTWRAPSPSWRRRSPRRWASTAAAPPSTRWPCCWAARRPTRHAAAAAAEGRGIGAGRPAVRAAGTPPDIAAAERAMAAPMPASARQVGVLPAPGYHRRVRLSRRSWAICSSGPAARSCWVRWWARRCRCRSSTAAAARPAWTRPRGVRGRRGAVPADGAECVPRGRGQSGEPADSGGPDAGGEAAHAVPGGAINYLDVIEADRSVLQQQRVSVQLSGEQARSAVGLIRALGGDGAILCLALGLGRWLRSRPFAGGRWVCSLPLNCVLCFVGPVVAAASWAAPRAAARLLAPRSRSGAFAPDFPFVILVAACGGCLRIPSGASRLLAAARPSYGFRRVTLLDLWLVTRFVAQKLAARGQFRIRVLRWVSTLRADTGLGKLAASRTAAYREPS